MSRRQGREVEIWTGVKTVSPCRMIWSWPPARRSNLQVHTGVDLFFCWRRLAWHSGWQSCNHFPRDATCERGIPAPLRLLVAPHALRSPQPLWNATPENNLFLFFHCAELVPSPNWGSAFFFFLLSSPELAKILDFRKRINFRGVLNKLTKYKINRPEFTAAWRIILYFL